jgi:hypothetical protein
MAAQPRGGHVFNMDGAGADGSATPRFAAYGATKRSLAQLGASLQAELGLAKVTKVGVHNLSPGMVTTELLMSGADTPTAKFFINCLGEGKGVCGRVGGRGGGSGTRKAGINCASGGMKVSHHQQWGLVVCCLLPGCQLAPSLVVPLAVVTLLASAC